jgi:hypothetical protein
VFKAALTPQAATFLRLYLAKKIQEITELDSAALGRNRALPPQRVSSSSITASVEGHDVPVGKAQPLRLVAHIDFTYFLCARSFFF